MSANDVAHWVQEMNVCWFVQRTVLVRRKYGLTVSFPVNVTVLK